MKFWAKAERVVNYKSKSITDARKKEVMDKHLTFLVEQTQRYSSMLAQRLHSGLCLWHQQLVTLFRSHCLRVWAVGGNILVLLSWGLGH